jgi:transcriptional regulator with XRE-family HTH domain
MGHKPRYRPQYLAAKLLQIRRGLGLSQPKLARLLNVGITDARVCEFEKGKREPNLITLLAYAYLIGISTDALIDDAIGLPAQIKIKRQRKQVTLLRTK